MNKFLIFLTLDLGSKYLAAVIAPSNDFFKLTYNTEMAFRYDGGALLKYIIPIIFIPIFAMALMKVSPRSLPLMLAGMIGNLFCRFLPSGVVDFINFQVFINNFADIYMWIASGIVFIDSLKFYKAQKFKLESEELLSKEYI